MTDPAATSDAGTIVIGLLTGGQSTRMGSDKATTLIAGETMAARVASACAATGFETIVLGPDDAGTGLPYLADDGDAPAGPLGGLITLLRRRPGAHVLLVATDQPFVRTETLRQLAAIAPCDVAVPIDDDGWPQVTCARYGPAVIDECKTGDIFRLRSLLDRLDTVRVLPATWRSWGEDGRSFASLDRPDDIDTALATYGSDSPGREPGAAAD